MPKELIGMTFLQVDREVGYGLLAALLSARLMVSSNEGLFIEHFRGAARVTASIGIFKWFFGAADHLCQMIPW